MKFKFNSVFGWGQTSGGEGCSASPQPPAGYGPASCQGVFYWNIVAAALKQ